MSVIAGISAIEQDLLEVDNISALVDKLITLGNKITDNKETLEKLSDDMRNELAKGMFMTMDEVGLALRCKPDKAAEYLTQKGIPMHKAGRGYVVSKAQFKKYFEGNAGQ